MIDDEELMAGLAFLVKHAHDDYEPGLKLAIDACREVQARRERTRVRMLPAGEMELSVGVANALAQLGCVFVGEVERLMSLPDMEILARGKKARLGKKGLKEVREVLKNIGLGGVWP